jgi:REP element-mobilizing transposase RayT
MARRYVMVKRKYLKEKGIYHVIQRAPGNELLFKDDRDRVIFLRYMKSYLLKFDIQILAYALMPNHLHLLLKIEKINLSMCMKQLFERYACYFNNKHQRKGHVFYGVYRAVYCDNPFAVLIVSYYIHLNAFKAKIVNSPLDYKWHSLDIYLGRRTTKFLNFRFVLDFINKDLKTARNVYSKLINQICEIGYKDVAKYKDAISKFYDACSKRIRMIDLF